jgi:hypothetical protein
VKRLVKALYTIVALLIVILAIGVAGCIGPGEEEATPTATPAEETTTPTPTEAPVTTPVQEISCLLCHKEAENLTAHQHGGDKCLKCHGDVNANVHTVHPESVTCKLCHGMPPTIPQPVDGYTVCENCHAYPDATKSVEGNLVKIHLPRGKDCTVCHVGDISVIHSAKTKVLQ